MRRLAPPTEPPVLISDTVGFIKKLPHDLVASFRSTLDEAGDADLLLHVVDAVRSRARRSARGHARRYSPKSARTRRRRGSLLNKIDRVRRRTGAPRSPIAIPARSRCRRRRAVDVAMLRERLIEHFAGALEETELDVPWAQQKLVHAIHERATVLAEAHDETGTRLRIRAPASVIADLTARLT